jgi:MFS family permease
LERCLIFENPWALLGSRAVIGFATACIVTACIGTISTLFDGTNHAKALGVSGALASGMSLVGLLTGGARCRLSAGGPLSFNIRFSPLFAWCWPLPISVM